MAELWADYRHLSRLRLIDGARLGPAVQPDAMGGPRPCRGSEITSRVRAALRREATTPGRLGGRSRTHRSHGLRAPHTSHARFPTAQSVAGALRLPPHPTTSRHVRRRLV